MNIRTLLFLLSGFSLQYGCVTAPPPAKPAATEVQVLAKSSRSWDGAVLPEYPQGQPEVTILHITIPAGTRLNSHTHPVINAGVLLRGQLTVITHEGKTLDLKAGDAIVEVVDTIHYGINRGDVPAEIIVFYAGVADTPVTVTVPEE